MSDTILTAEQINDLRQQRALHLLTVNAVCDSHEALRQQVATLTLELDSVRTDYELLSADYRDLSQDNAKLRADAAREAEMSDRISDAFEPAMKFRDSGCIYVDEPRLKRVVGIHLNLVAPLTAERDALREERDNALIDRETFYEMRNEREAAQKAMSYASEQAHLEWTRADRLERELAEARAEIRLLMRQLPQASTEAAPPAEGPTTECCGEPLQADVRFCPKCGYEARATPPRGPAGKE